MTSQSFYKNRFPLPQLQKSSESFASKKFRQTSVLSKFNDEVKIHNMKDEFENQSNLEECYFNYFKIKQVDVTKLINMMT